MVLVQITQNYYTFRRGQIIPAEIKGKFLKSKEVYIPLSVVRILTQDNFVNSINQINKKINKQPKPQINTLWDIIKEVKKSLNFTKK